MAANTTIIFVPGAWHKSQTWAPVAKILSDAGYKTELVDLASVGPSEHLPDFGKDVTTIRERIQQAADAGQKILLVVHSYGGVPTSEAVKGLDLATREKEGKKGGVAHVYYCASFIISEGQSLHTAFNEKTLPWYQISEDKMEITPATPEVIFYNDLSEADAKANIEKLRPHSYQTLHSPLTYAVWKHVPCTYLYCLQDNAIPIDIQKLMVEGTAQGYNVRTETLDASHSPFLSQPKETAESIKRAAEL